MLFNRKSTGVEISPAGIAFALMGGTRKAPCLERTAMHSLPPGTVQASLREPNILDRKAFAAKLNEAHNLLLHKGKRLSVSLPDTTGRVMLMDMEERFKNRSEALDMIRWKLKKNMPFDMADAHLDYQLLMKRENGEMALLVCLVSKPVMEQYEEVFSEAGFSAAVINLNSINLCRTLEQKLELMGDCVFLSLYGNTLGVMMFSGGIPVFVRFKELAGMLTPDSRLYAEIRNSLLACRERFPEQPQKIACMAHPAMAGEFREMLAEAAGMEPVMMETCPGVSLSGDAPAGRDSLFPFSAAIGAALRGL